MMARLSAMMANQRRPNNAFEPTPQRGTKIGAILTVGISVAVFPI